MDRQLSRQRGKMKKMIDVDILPVKIETDRQIEIDEWVGRKRRNNEDNIQFGNVLNIIIQVER